jgi:hypothetical protein
MPQSSDAAATSDPQRGDAPVFVLTASRSGSTLLRFLLDSHPRLACPPETSIATMCAAMVQSLEVLESAGSGNRRRQDQAPAPSPAIAAAIRNAVDSAFGEYLARHGKGRWCDKSLDTFQYAEILAQIYPEAQFICLYRHCMDVIASGVEACPWGLHRFGFDAHVAQFPGNSVAAIGSYWLTCAQSIMAFEQKHPERCLRVRYEDLATAPEETAARVFSFLGVEQVPGIVEHCFQSQHEGEGPGDEKIWFTAEVSASSLGRGVSVPVAALVPPLLQGINQGLGNLGYRLVGEDWNGSAEQLDPRADLPAPAASPGDEDVIRAESAITEAFMMTEALGERIRSQGASLHEQVTACWPAISGATIELVVQADHGNERSLRLGFPADAASLTIEIGVPQAAADEQGTKLIARRETWQALLDGTSNPMTDITAGRLRCVYKRDGHRLRSDEVHAVATLLGIARVPLARA